MIKNAIEIKKLHKIYDNQFEALKSIDLNIPKGIFLWSAWTKWCR